jgi:hypothetical protein
VSDGARVLAGLVGDALPGRPASPAGVLSAWVEAVAPRGDGLDGLRVQLAEHAAAGLAAVLPLSQVTAVGGACESQSLIDHGGDLRW